MTGAPEGSTKSISGEAGNRTCDPLFKRHGTSTITWRLQCIGYRRSNSCLWPCSLAVPVLAGWVYDFVVLCPAQPAVVLVLKRLRRRGDSLKSHQTDWEKPVIELAISGLQYIGLSPTPRGRRNLHFETDQVK